MNNQAVPVVMYHSIRVIKENSPLKHLLCPLELFENHLQLLKKNNINTISLQELYNYMKNGIKINGNSIVLTFDDGYLDNWVFAYPLLKKYGFKGTIYVNPEFVDSRSIVRNNLQYVWDNKRDIEHLETTGFLSWEEMKIMESEGVMDIQSHSMSHTWYFCGDEIVDFHHPGSSQYPWLFWNARPERKSFYLNENQESFVPYGTPVFKHGRSLGIRRYFDDEGLRNHIVDFVGKQGDAFFNSKDWKNNLFHKVEHYKKENKLVDRYETDEEQEARYRYELIESRSLLEKQLNKRVHSLCWAGSAFNDKALSIANEAGYISSTVFYNNRERKNRYGEDPSFINRTGCGSSFDWHNKFISYTDPGYFMASLKYFHGNRVYLWIMRLYKLKYLLRHFIVKLLKTGEQ